jgi:hypothetical protein
VVVVLAIHPAQFCLFGERCTRLKKISTIY